MKATVAIIGSGFAGSILGRILADQGHRVLLFERQRHPRFALGESSTPLAALSLERLSRDWQLRDLDALAAYGRWNKELGHLRKGLKRGFTFYQHTRGSPYTNDELDCHRLLVAASPNQEIADCHWLRADVDAHLASAAAAAGAELLEEVEVTGVEARGEGFKLSWTTRGGRLHTETASHLIDGSGRSGVLGTTFPEARSTQVGLETSLVAGHFGDVAPFPDVARAAAACVEDGPYPDEAAAVHHLLGDSWLYLLRFDDGTSSIGLVRAATQPHAPAAPPETLLRRALEPFPTLHQAFDQARPTSPVVHLNVLPYRRLKAGGSSWALLPHSYAFYDPLFSTGIAWSLIAVERLAGWGLELREHGRSAAAQTLRRYCHLIEKEADHLESLITTAWRALPLFDDFVEVCYLYFAAASFSELRQRLCPEQTPLGGWCWDGFLGASDPLVSQWPEQVSAWLRESPATAPGRRVQPRQLRELIEPRNLIGLGDPAIGRRIPLDLGLLRHSASKLGLQETTMGERLSRLR